MPIRSHITDPSSGKKAAVTETDCNKNAVVAATCDLNTYYHKTLIFLNDTYGQDMNVEIEFGATPEGVYDGQDRTLWTASTPIGGAGDFIEDSTDHAKNARITVTNNAAIGGGDTITITTSATGATVLTEGVDWNKLGNAAATIDSIATAIDGVAILSSADDGVDTANLYTSNTEDIETITFSGAGLSQSAQCVNASGSSNNDTLQFAKGGDLDLTGYVALTGYIYITGWASTNQNVRLQGYDTDATTTLGGPISLSDYVNTTPLNAWQKFTIPLDDMGLTGITTLDALRMTTVDTGGGAPPNYYVDYIQFEQAGTADPTRFTIKPDPGTWYYVYKLTWSLADALNISVANGTAPGLSYDQLLGEASLSNGIVYQRVENEKIVQSSTIHNLADIMTGPDTELKVVVCDGTNTFVKIISTYEEPIILKSENSDELRIIISDDLSGLLLFRGRVSGKEWRREEEKVTLS